ncbi:unnamed protein product [Clavelina lepadiformis]|uniref:Uncharacterized protein n=1 Tax=Clavelina lepadiformis TaxID=159417 RepID=A0ABP0G9R0_CLALP
MIINFLIIKPEIAECDKVIFFDNAEANCMKKLNLSSNNLGDDGASHISTCLSKIEKLHIGWCEISASGIESISDAISKLPEPEVLHKKSHHPVRVFKFIFYAEANRLRMLSETNTDFTAAHQRLIEKCLAFPFPRKVVQQTFSCNESKWSE